MVRDDDVDSAFSRAPHYLLRPDAGIDAHDQLHAGVRRPLDHFRAHAIAFLEPVGHVEDRVAAGQLNGLFQDDDGDRSIHVVVAVDQDFLLRLDGRAQPGDGVPHSGQQERIVQVVERRGQESPGGLGIFQAATQQHACG